MDAEPIYKINLELKWLGNYPETSKLHRPSVDSNIDAIGAGTADSKQLPYFVWLSKPGEKFMEHTRKQMKSKVMRRVIKWESKLPVMVQTKAARDVSVKKFTETFNTPSIVKLVKGGGILGQSRKWLKEAKSAMDETGMGRFVGVGGFSAWWIFYWLFTAIAHIATITEELCDRMEPLLFVTWNPARSSDQWDQVIFSSGKWCYWVSQLIEED